MRKAPSEMAYYTRLGMKYRNITRTNEELLLNGYQTGTPEYRKNIEDILVGKNIGLVMAIAGGYKSQLKHTIINFHDLMGVGFEGLQHAARKYSKGKGAKFSYYASFWIKQRMQREIDKNRSGRELPIKRSESIRGVHNRREEFVAEYGHYPTAGELAEYMRVNQEEIEEVMRASQSIFDLDVRNNRDETVEPDGLAVDENWEEDFNDVERDIATRDFYAEPLEGLTREKVEMYLELGADPKVVERRLLDFYESGGRGKKALKIYLEGMTMEQSGDIAGVCRENVRQSKERAVKQISESLGIPWEEKKKRLYKRHKKEE